MVKLLNMLRTRWDGLLAQLASFGLIGALNFVVDTAIFNALFAIGPVKSQVIATVVATTLSYFLNRHWTFRNHERAGLRREYTLFFLLNGVGLAITAGIVGVAKYGFDLHDQWVLNVVRLVGIAVATVFRFWSYRRWVFVPASMPVNEAMPATGAQPVEFPEIVDAEPAERPAVVGDQRDRRSAAVSTSSSLR
jgi:putative flippase GtrA